MSKPHSHPIAVIGMACRYPGARNLIEFWENILCQRQQFRTLPDARLPLSEYFSADWRQADKTYAQKAALIDGFEFDPCLYRIPQSTFESTDSVHWLALATALDAFEDAGLSDDHLLRDRCGVILGNSLTGEESRANALRLRWPYVLKAFRQAAANQGLESDCLSELEQQFEQFFQSAFPAMDGDSLVGALSNTIAGRICNYLDLKGGGYVVDGACASSLLAVGTAIDYLSQGKLDLALAGGVDMSLDPLELVGFAKTMALTPDFMRVYDRSGNGFIAGEGCGMVVLKRLEEAQRDGNRIYAVIRGWGMSSDGHGSMILPNSDAQAAALVRAYHAAGYSPQSLDFVEGHGTATLQGDRIELEGIAKGIAQFGKCPEHSIGITSLKSITGHTKAAAGIGGLIKSVIAVNRRVLPPTAGCLEPHDRFLDQARILYPITHGQIFRKKAQLRAGVSALGFGGINCHLTLESGDAPSIALEPALSEACLLASKQFSEVFPLTAVDSHALLDEIQALRKRAIGMAEGELIDLAAECSLACVQGKAWRAAVVAEHVADLLSKLDLLMQRIKQNPNTSLLATNSDGIYFAYQPSKPLIGFIFPGEGSQHVNMAARLVQRFDWAKSFVEDASRLAQIVADDHDAYELEQCWFKPVQRDPAQLLRKQWQSQLAQTRLAQPAICAASWIWYQYLRDLGITPDLAIGYGVGELTALAAASSISPQRLIQISAIRGVASELYQSNGVGMLALECSLSTAQNLLQHLTDYCSIACIDGPNQIVVSAVEQALVELQTLADTQHIKTCKLPLNNGYHSELMRSAARVLEQHQQIPESIQAPLFPVFSGLDSNPFVSGMDLRVYLAKQITHPFNFNSLLRQVGPQCDWLIEVGPGSRVSDLVNQHSDLTCQSVEHSVGDDRALSAIVAEAFVRGLDLNWSVLYQNRLVRRFVPAQQRQFFRNPCERPLRLVDKQTSAEQASAGPIMPNRNQSPRSVLLKLIEEYTGFSVVSITDTCKLIDDLNLDSIKISALLANAAQQLKLPAAFDPTQWAAFDVGGIINGLEQAMLATDDFSEAPQSAPAWVRSFYQTWQADNPLSKGHSVGSACVVLQSGNQEWASSLANRLDLPIANQIIADSEHWLLLWENPLVENWSQLVNQLCLFQRIRQHQPSHWRALRGVAFLVRSGDEFNATLPLSSFAASLHADCPELELHVVEFDQALSAFQVGDALKQLWFDKPGFHHIRIDQYGLTYRPHLTALDLGICAPRPAQLNTDDVILVTGGGKGITAECAYALVTQYQVRLAILGRSEPASDAELQATLDRLNQTAPRHHYYVCDVSQAESLDKRLRQIEQELGPIAGVLHGAGINIPQPVQMVSVEQAEYEIGAKLYGLQHLLTYFETRSLKWLAVLTSITGVTGMQGNAWYAFANQAATQSLQHFAATHPQTATAAYAFSAWAECGMAHKLDCIETLRNNGYQAMTIEEGVRQFLRWLSYAPPAVQIVVAAEFEHTLLSADKETCISGRFLGHTSSWVAGVERITEVSLSLAQDQYLNDHQLHGSYVFPAVMGLEAMAQNATALLARPELEIVSIRNICLHRAIVLNSSAEQPIMISALLQERLSQTQAFCVETQLYRPGQSQICFSAEFIFGHRTQQRPLHPAQTHQELAVVPERDLYGPVLFQGPLFHRIRSVYALDEQQAILTAHAQLFAHRNVAGFAEAVGGPLLLGDPYCRDAYFQSAQLPILPEISVPIFIEAIELFQGNQDPGYRLVHTQMTRLDAQRFSANIEVMDRKGNLVERLTGVQVQSVKRDPNLPNASQLLAKAEQSLDSELQDQIDHLAGALGAVAPAVLLQHIPGLARDQSARRRNLELPLIRAAIKRAEQRFKQLSPMQISGLKFVMEDIAATKLKPQQRPRVSLSHDADWMLCVAGIGDQGCELSRVSERSQQEWLALLSPAWHPHLTSLSTVDSDLNRAATRLRAAAKVATNVFGERAFDLTPVQIINDAVLFEADVDARRVAILTFSLTLGPYSYALAIVLTRLLNASDQSQERVNTGKRWSDWGGYTETHGMLSNLHAELTTEEDDSRSIRFRFPLAFREAANPDGSLYFARIIDWMGRLRELALQPLQTLLNASVTDGAYAWVTNESLLRVTHPVEAGATVEAVCRFAGRHGPHDASVRVTFDWSCISEDEQTSLAFASSEIEMTWCRVDEQAGHIPCAYPRYLDDFFNRFIGHSKPPGPWSTDERLRRLGKLIWQADAKPNGDLFLLSLSPATSLNEANLIGNIYFAKYYEWQGLLRDQYLYTVVPEAYRPNNQNGGLRCIESRVAHLRDAQPFETLEVRLYLHALHAQGIIFSFEFYRIEPQQPPLRLAHGRQIDLWCTLDAGKRDWRAMNLPQAVIDTLTQCIERNTASQNE